MKIRVQVIVESDDGVGEFGNLIWVLPSFWCKRRGSLLIGASQLLITVMSFRRAAWIFIINRSRQLAEISPPFEAFNTSVL